MRRILLVALVPDHEHRQFGQRVGARRQRNSRLREIAHQTCRQQARHARKHRGPAQKSGNAAEARYRNRDIAVEAGSPEPAVEIEPLVVSIDNRDMPRRKIVRTRCRRLARALASK